ncbi:TPA: ribonuclease III, partial [Candidatus Scatenecus faecavium]|nr:ribonuclease III [Candidatus Scatenecus faecavium]
EYTQSINKKTPVYKLIAEDGPAHNKVFTVEVWYNGEFIARACGKSKKEAEQKCAFEACKKLGVSECQK